MSEGETKLRTPADILRARRAKGRIDVTPGVKTEIIARLRAGEFLADMECDAHIPSATRIIEARKTDPEFDAAYQDALAHGLDTTLADAGQFARDAAETGNIDDIRTAEIFTRTIALAAEKLAPKTHGTLVKHAGADGGALNVIVTNYAKDIRASDKPE